MFFLFIFRKISPLNIFLKDQQSVGLNNNIFEDKYDLYLCQMKLKGNLSMYMSQIVNQDPRFISKNNI